MIVAFAGRRADALSCGQTAIAERIGAEFLSLSPSVVVGAAADGGDILVLEAALALRIRPAVHLVLATAPEVFRQDSVTPAWQARFDAVLDELARAGDRIESLHLDPVEESYRLANQVIVDRAAAAAGGNGAVALVIADEGRGVLVGDLVARARQRGMPVRWVGPAAAARPPS